MIGIQLKGRLGNQMFQYAAAKTLAERLNCRLLIAGNTLGRRFGFIGHCLQFDRYSPVNKMQQNGVLHTAFGCGPSFCWGRAVELTIPWIRRALMPQVFRPRRSKLGEAEYECFDDTILLQSPGTWLDGWFQSASYFFEQSDRVRDWFRPKPDDQARIEEVLAGWPQPPDRMAAVHLRRGDYGTIRDALSGHESGWLLPISYYQEALASLPPGTGLAIFSDDPDWAADVLADRQPWISRGNSALLDLQLMARCHWIVTANSSFSWWAGWLNEDASKVVLAPKFHLGWRVGEWVPGGIAVPGWRYLTVNE